jgi:hypothetical protein
MTYRTRFVLLTASNCGIVLVILSAAIFLKVDLSKRLIDLKLDNSRELLALLGFIGGMIIASITNFLILSSPKNEFTSDEVSQIIRELKAFQ